MFPQYTWRERVADGCIHVVGVTASLVAAVVLMIAASQMLPTHSILPLGIYSTGLVAMFGCSAAYNLTMRPRPKEVLRRFDHAAIFVMIAGTYTPIALLAIGGTWGVVLFVVVWSLTLIGVAIKLFYPRTFERTSIAIYLAQGWAALITIDPLVSSVPGPSLLLLGIGGILYTVGVAFHLWRSLRYHNAIWHGFVLVATSLHYAAMLAAMRLL
jgi:hemolysin III